MQSKLEKTFNLGVILSLISLVLFSISSMVVYVDMYDFSHKLVRYLERFDIVNWLLSYHNEFFDRLNDSIKYDAVLYELNYKLVFLSAYLYSVTIIVITSRSWIVFSDLSRDFIELKHSIFLGFMVYICLDAAQVGSAFSFKDGIALRVAFIGNVLHGAAIVFALVFWVHVIVIYCIRMLMFTRRFLIERLNIG